MWKDNIHSISSNLSLKNPATKDELSDIQKCLHVELPNDLYQLLQETYCAMGDGGNMICCIPKQDLVVVSASEIMPNARDRWELIVKYILPGIQSNK